MDSTQPPCDQVNYLPSTSRSSLFGETTSDMSRSMLDIWTEFIKVHWLGSAHDNKVPTIQQSFCEFSDLVRNSQQKTNMAKLKTKVFFFLMEICSDKYGVITHSLVFAYIYIIYMCTHVREWAI